ncbi:potassium channel family protein [Candidatus Altiarchaeota archaeon]
MYLIIIGGGGTGRALANHLVGEGHEVVIIEEEEDAARGLADNMDALVIHGDGSKTEILKDAGIDKADGIVILTSEDNTNLTICQMAKKFNVPRIVARVNDPNKKDLYIGLEITAAISPITAIVSYFKNALTQEAGGRSISSIANGNAEVIELRLGNQELDGKKIKDAGLPEGCIVAVIYRQGEVIICNDDTIIRKDDILTVITKTDVVKDVLTILKG